ncbi:MAG: hypothetical protein V4547_16205 [Bacteroidota bacterium]
MKEKNYFLIYNYFTGQNMTVTASEKKRDKLIKIDRVTSYRPINYSLFLMYKSLIKKNKKHGKNK